MGVKGARKEGALHTLMESFNRSTRESLTKEVARLRASNKSVREIVRELNKAKIISPRGFKITTSNVRNYIKWGYEAGALTTTRLDGKPSRIFSTKNGQPELRLELPKATTPAPSASTDLARVMDVLVFASKWDRNEAVSTLQQALAILTNLPAK